MVELVSLAPTAVGMALPLAAAGWAFLTWIVSGSLGLAILVFLALKAFGR